MIVNYLNNGGVQKCTREEINRVIEESLKYLNQPTEMEVNIAFATEDEIKNVNNKSRNKNTATDVLSFPSFELEAGEIVKIKEDKYKWNINPENNHFVLGDILLCTAVAKKQAANLKHTLKLELIRLCVHSLLHLLGYDHIEEADKKKMHPLEVACMKNAGYEIIE